MGRTFAFWGAMSPPCPAVPARRRQDPSSWPKKGTAAGARQRKKGRRRGHDAGRRLVVRRRTDGSRGHGCRPFLLSVASGPGATCLRRKMAVVSAAAEMAHSTSSKPIGRQRSLQRVIVATKVRMARLNRIEAVMGDRVDKIGQLVMTARPGTNNVKAIAARTRTAFRSSTRTATSRTAITPRHAASIKSEPSKRIRVSVASG